MPNNVGDLGKLIVAKGFKKLPKVQKIAQSGHTEYYPVIFYCYIEKFSVYKRCNGSTIGRYHHDNRTFACCATSLGNSKNSLNRKGRL